MSKYCTLPGQEPVRLESLDGHIIIIGDTLRDIPEQFILKARAAGCLTEEELTALNQRLLGGDSASQHNEENILNSIAGCTSIAELYKFQSAENSQTVIDAINLRGTELDGQAKLLDTANIGSGNQPSNGVAADTVKTSPGLPNLDSKDDGFAPPPTHPAPPAANNERNDQIKAAVIELVNTGNAADLTSSGAPKVEALRELCGFDVTGQERDAAYDAVKG